MVEDLEEVDLVVEEVDLAEVVAVVNTVSQLLDQHFLCIYSYQLNMLSKALPYPLKRHEEYYKYSQQNP